MKVFVATRCAAPVWEFSGGMDYACEQDILILKALKFEVIVATTEHPQHRGAQFEEEEENLKTIWLPAKAGGYSPEFFEGVSRTYERYKPFDFILSESTGGEQLLGVATCPIMLRSHGLDISSGFRNRMTNFIFNVLEGKPVNSQSSMLKDAFEHLLMTYTKREKLNRYDMVACLTETERDDLLSFVLVPKRKVAVLPLCIAEPPPASLQKDEGLYLTGAAKIDLDYKNIPALLREATARGIPLTVIGGRFQKIASVFPHLHSYTGLLDKQRLFSLLSKASVLIDPSFHYSGLNTIRIEALAVGTPTVAFDIGGSREAVLDGVTGYLVEPFNWGALFDAAKQASKNAAMRAECREYFEKKFSRTSFTAAFLSVLGRLGVG